MNWRIRCFCYKLFDNRLLLQIVGWEVSVVNCGTKTYCVNCRMRSLCCKLWNEKFLQRIVEWEVFAANCGMRNLSVNCQMRSFCSGLRNESLCCELWIGKFVLQIVDWVVLFLLIVEWKFLMRRFAENCGEIFLAVRGMRSFCCKVLP